MVEKGATPGGVIVNIRQVEARVDAVNDQDRTVLLTGPDGNRLRLSVDVGVSGLAALSAGDVVVAR